MNSSQSLSNLPEALLEIIQLRLLSDADRKKFWFHYYFYRRKPQLIKQRQRRPFHGNRTFTETLALLAATDSPTPERWPLTQVELRQEQRWQKVFWQAQTSHEYFLKLRRQSPVQLFAYLIKIICTKPTNSIPRDLAVRLACFVIDIQNAKPLYAAIKRYPKRTVEDLCNCTVDKPYAIYPKPGGAIVYLDQFDFEKIETGANAITRLGGKSPQTIFPNASITLVNDGTLKQHASARRLRKLATTIKHERYHVLYDNYYNSLANEFELASVSRLKACGISLKKHQATAGLMARGMHKVMHTEVIAALSNKKYPRDFLQLNVPLIMDMMEKLLSNLWSQNWSVKTKQRVLTPYQQAYESVLRYYPRYQAWLATALRYHACFPKKLPFARLEAIVLTTPLEKISELESWLRDHFLPNYSSERILEDFTTQLLIRAKKIHQATRGVTQGKRLHQIYSKYLQSYGLQASGYHSPATITVLCTLLADCTLPFIAQSELLPVLKFILEAWASELTASELRYVQRTLVRVSKQLNKKACLAWYYDDCQKQITQLRQFIQTSLRYGGVDFRHNQPRVIAAVRHITTLEQLEYKYLSARQLQRLVRRLRHDDEKIWSRLIQSGTIIRSEDIATLFYIYQWCPNLYLNYQAQEQLLYIIRHRPVSPDWLKKISQAARRVLTAKYMTPQHYFFAKLLRRAADTKLHVQKLSAKTGS